MELELEVEVGVVWATAVQNPFAWMLIPFLLPEYLSAEAGVL